MLFLLNRTNPVATRRTGVDFNARTIIRFENLTVYGHSSKEAWH
jgi:hypothetical protein